MVPHLALVQLVTEFPSAVAQRPILQLPAVSCELNRAAGTAVGEWEFVVQNLPRHTSLDEALELNNGTDDGIVLSSAGAETERCLPVAVILIHVPIPVFLLASGPVFVIVFTVFWPDVGPFHAFRPPGGEQITISAHAAVAFPVGDVREAAR